jgi:hypothetical protein
MSDIVTGMPAAIGYTNGHHNNGNYGYAYNHGISDKDQMFAANIDAGERTRDILGAIASSITATEKTGAASVLATEKIGAAAELTAEKIGAAGVLATHNASSAQLLAMHNLAHANTLAMQLGFKDAAMQLAECCCDIKKDIADVKATILAVDAHRIRDDLNEARAELLAAKYARGGNGNGNG